MLGKLIKYDLRSMSKLLILLHIPVVFLAVAARYAGVLRLYAFAKPEPIAILTLVVAVTYLSFTGFLTQLYTAVYSYRKLFSREGYLTFTLPVKASTQVLAKFLSGSVWIMINVLLVFAAMAFVIYTPPLYEDLTEGLARTIGDGSACAHFILLLFLLSIIGCFSNMAMALGCISFGHCFRKHRVLTAIACYAGLTILMQIIGACAQVFTTFRNPSFYQDDLTFGEFLSLYTPLFYIVLVSSVLVGVICYIFSCYVMKNRLNLD